MDRRCRAGAYASWQPSAQLNPPLLRQDTSRASARDFQWNGPPGMAEDRRSRVIVLWLLLARMRSRSALSVVYTAVPGSIRQGRPSSSRVNDNASAWAWPGDGPVVGPKQ